MEINNFYNDINEEENISNQSLLDQRLKLNPKVFLTLNKDYLKLFYQEHKEEVIALSVTFVPTVPYTFLDFFVFGISKSLPSIAFNK